jgi:hypothetical protein
VVYLKPRPLQLGIMLVREHSWDPSCAGTNGQAVFRMHGMTDNTFSGLWGYEEDSRVNIAQLRILLQVSS